MALPTETTGYGRAPGSERLIAADLSGPTLSVGSVEQLFARRVRAVRPSRDSLVVTLLSTGSDFLFAGLALHRRPLRP